MGFDQAAINTLVDNITSHARRLGIFTSVNFHEPKAALGAGLHYAVWVQTIDPLGPASGLDATSGYVVAVGRIYGNMIAKPEDEIDPRLMTAASTLMNAYTGDFNFGASVRALDLLGMYGQRMGARAAYLPLGGGTYRIMEITIPVVVNDLWTQVE